MAMKIATKVETVTIHEVYYQDQWGRWMKYADYPDKHVAETKGVRDAKRFELSNRNADWSGYLEPGRDHIPRTPHGD